MDRVMIFAAAACLLACPPPHPTIDAGEDAGEDAGVDAGRPRGDDPPTGWSTAIEMAADASVTTRLGASVASAGDKYGQPLIAGVYDDPNGDGSGLDTRVFFTRWNGTDRKFDDLKTVEVVGNIALANPMRQVAIARNAETEQIGIVYVKSPDLIRYAWSDDEGANFSLQTVSNAAGLQPINPQLAMKGDTLWVGYATSDRRVVVRKRVGAGAFVDSEAPVPPGTSNVVALPISLQLDSAGNPGLLYFASSAGVPTITLAFWRPGTATSTVIADSALVQLLGVIGRDPSATLSFAGDKPRAAFHLRHVSPTLLADGGVDPADDTPELFYAAATDAAGITWSAPVPMPRNGDGLKYNSTRWYQGLVVDASGRISLAADFAANGIVGGQCAGPKLARSTDGMSFTTCSPSQTPFNFAGDWLSLWPHNAAGKLTMIFYYDLRTNPLAKPGVAMWREP